MPVDAARFTKAVYGPYSGQEYRIRRIILADYLRALGVLPIQESTELQKQLQDVEGKIKERNVSDPEFELKTVKFYLERGVVDPPVFFGPYKECPEGNLHYDDMRPDSVFLINQIIEYSNLLVGIEEHRDFFFQPRTADTGPGGEAVRQASNGASAAGVDPEAP